MRCRLSGINIKGDSIMTQQLFPDSPVFTLLSERSDGEMGTSLNPGPDGRFLKHRIKYLAEHGLNAEKRLVLAGLVKRAEVRLVMAIPEIDHNLRGRDGT